MFKEIMRKLTDKDGGRPGDSEHHAEFESRDPENVSTYDQQVGPALTCMIMWDKIQVHPMAGEFCS